MCWDSVFHQSPKSLSRRDFDHPQAIDREGLLTCLLHFSFWVKGIMVSAVSRMLRQDLNTVRGHNIFFFYFSFLCCFFFFISLSVLPSLVFSFFFFSLIFRHVFHFPLFKKKKFYFFKLYEFSIHLCPQDDSALISRLETTPLYIYIYIYIYFSEPFHKFFSSIGNPLPLQHKNVRQNFT